MPVASKSVEDPAIAKQLFDQYKKNPKTLRKMLPEGVRLSDLGVLFLNVYDNWNDKVIERTNNVSKFGWRSLVIERLLDYDVNIKDNF